MKKSAKKYVYKPAFDDAKKEDKGTVVSASRARWKMKHNEPKEDVIRMVRFVWMRALAWDDRFKLHKRVFGDCVHGGYLARAIQQKTPMLVVTEAGEKLLKNDRYNRPLLTGIDMAVFH